MKKYSLCIVSFAIAICLLFSGILIVAASGNDDIAQTYCVVGFSTDGGSYIESVRVRKGGKVTRPEDPEKPGYLFAGWYTGSHYTMEYDFNTPVEYSMNIFAKWEVDPLAAQKAADSLLKFKDVNKSHWFYESVHYVFEKGLMNGISETEFNPNGDFTRAMFVTVLYRLQKEPATNAELTFTDVKPGSYYEKAVIWAQKHGIVNGVTPTEFSPDTPITREQTATIMYRYAEYARLDRKIRGKLEYSDKRDISKYAEDAVLWASTHNLMGGNDDGNFEPKRNTTRAEAASVFMVTHRDLR